MPVLSTAALHTDIGLPIVSTLNISTGLLYPGGLQGRQRYSGYSAGLDVWCWHDSLLGSIGIDSWRYLYEAAQPVQDIPGGNINASYNYEP